MTTEARTHTWCAWAACAEIRSVVISISSIISVYLAISNKGGIKTCEERGYDMST